MSDPRPILSDAAIERAIAHSAPHGPDELLLGTIVAGAARLPQRRGWTSALPRISIATRRPLVFVALALISVTAMGVLLFGGSATRPTPSLDPLQAPNGPITLSGFVPTSGSDGAVVGMPTCATCPAGTAPSWSRDGKTIAFIARGGELWTWHEGDASARQVVGCPNAQCPASSPSWSPDGQSILFVGHGRLNVVDVATLEIRQLPLPTLAAPVAAASWSATDRIAFLISDRTTQRWSAWVADSDGSQPVSVATSGRDSDGLAGIALSPSGDRLVLLEDPSTPGTSDGFTIRIWVYATDGSPRRLIYERPGCCLGLAGFSEPTWSPDGARIAVVALTNLRDNPTSGDVALLSIDATSGDRTVLAPVPLRSAPAVPAAEMLDMSAPAWRPIPSGPAPTP